MNKDGKQGDVASMLGRGGAERSSGTALVLGGTAGLGLASANALGSKGFNVAVCGRDSSRLDEAVQALNAVTDVLGVRADVTQSDEIARAIKLTQDRFGSVDVLVANGGGPALGGFFEIADEQWRDAYELSLMSVVRSIRAVVPGMIAAGGGRIIIIGSSSVRRPIAGLTLSNAFRPAVAGLMKDLAVTLAPNRITVNMVGPGRIATDRIRALDQRRAALAGVSLDEVEAKSLAQIPMGRYGRPEEFGAVVAFLASAEASYVTGQTLLVDGAMVPTLP